MTDSVVPITNNTEEKITLKATDSSVPKSERKYRKCKAAAGIKAEIILWQVLTGVGFVGAGYFWWRSRKYRPQYQDEMVKASQRVASTPNHSDTKPSTQPEALNTLFG